MRTASLALIALAYAASLVSSTPNYSSKSVKVHSSSRHHTSHKGSSSKHATVYSTSKPSTPCSTTTVKSKTVKHTSKHHHSSSSSTVFGPTSSSTKRSEPVHDTFCTETTTSRSYVTSTVTISPILTVTYFGAGNFIDGDALTLTNGTATANITLFITTTLPDPFTFTIPIFPGTTVGTPSTITVPSPSGFLPVQSTLPDAVYQVEPDCNVTAVVITTTTFQFFTGPVSTTLSGTMIYFSSENTAYSADTFTLFPIVYSTTATYTATDYPGYTTTTVTATFTSTDVAPTTTVYQACATNNFADAVFGSEIANPIIAYQATSANQTIVPAPREIAYSPFSCCNFAFQQGADAWAYADEPGCSLIEDVEGVAGLCTPADTSDAVGVAGIRDPYQVDYVVGNALCGRFTRSYVDS